MKKEIVLLLKEAWRQISGAAPESDYFIFTHLAQERMREYHLTRQQIKDTYNKGNVVQQGMISRTYQGYAIGIYYKVDRVKDKVIIFSCWKRQSFRYR